MARPVAAVTVVIATRNRLPYLKEAMESVQRQSVVDCDLVVVDDASADGTGPWLRTVDSSSVHTVVLSDRVERSKARNIGLSLVRAPFVLFLDDDDRLAPTALHRLKSALIRHPNAIAAVGSRVDFRQGHMLRKGPGHPAFPMTTHAWELTLLGGWAAGLGQALFRTECVRSVGGCDERFSWGEDQLLWLRITRLGRVTFIPQVTLEVRRHEGHSRPPDAEAIEARFRAEHLATLPPRDASVGQRLLRARMFLRRSVRHSDARRGGRALGDLVRTARAYPPLLISPLFAQRFMLAIARAGLMAVVGKHGFERIRSVRRRVDLRLRRGLDVD
jgi:glycosyltransferase involved in cell wall biosynthesis